MKPKNGKENRNGQKGYKNEIIIFLFTRGMLGTPASRPIKYKNGINYQLYVFLDVCLFVCLCAWKREEEIENTLFVGGTSLFVPEIAQT